MANLIELQKGLERVSNESYLIALLFDAVRQTEKIALSLQKQQLNEGYDRNGQLIGIYSKTTEKLAKGRRTRKPKVAGEPYNFEDTGSFFDDMFLIFGTDEVTFFSKDDKTELLTDKYKNIFGLDDENLTNYLKNAILPLLITAIKKETGLLK